jgi:hypothetical protein
MTVLAEKRSYMCDSTFEVMTHHLMEYRHGEFCAKFRGDATMKAELLTALQSDSRTKDIETGFATKKTRIGSLSGKRECVFFFIDDKELKNMVIDEIIFQNKYGVTRR